MLYLLTKLNVTHEILGFKNQWSTPWSTFGALLEYFWDTRDTFGVLHGIHLGHFWSTFGVLLGHFWSTFGALLGALLEYFWSTFWAILEYFWNTFGQFWSTLRLHGMFL